MATYTRGQLLAEGKTKRIWAVQGYPDFCIPESKDDITAGDGVKHDVISGKAAMANQTTCNVFDLLFREGVPVAYCRQLDETSFLAERREMLPWEVVGRRRAWGSYLKRYPGVPQGQRFDPVLVEFFLKTSGKNFDGHPLPEDDPFALMEHTGSVSLYNPKLPMDGQGPFLVLPQVRGTEHYGVMARMTARTFEILEQAWATVGGRLIDFKIEFGLNLQGHVDIADVIDNDSWRVLDDKGEHIDKQAYRDGANLADVTAKYRYVAALTARF